MAKKGKKFLYFYKKKSFIKEHLTTINEIIENYTNFIDNSVILKDRYETNSNRNLKSSLKNKDRKSLEILNDQSIIFDKEELLIF